MRKVERDEGVFIFDDTVQEKYYTDENEIMCWYYGHSKGRRVQGFNIFNPSIVIFGGGISESSDLIFEPFNASLRAHIFNPAYLENLTITTAALGDDAGLLGALALVEMRKNNS